MSSLFVYFHRFLGNYVTGQDNDQFHSMLTNPLTQLFLLYSSSYHAIYSTLKVLDTLYDMVTQDRRAEKRTTITPSLFKPETCLLCLFISFVTVS